MSDPEQIFEFVLLRDCVRSIIFCMLQICIKFDLLLQVLVIIFRFTGAFERLN